MTTAPAPARTGRPADTVDAADLPREAVGGVRLCGVCRVWRPTETLVEDGAGVPVCPECRGEGPTPGTETPS